MNDARLIFINSAVSLSIISSYLFFTILIISKSIESPPISTNFDATIPPKLTKETSTVPPPTLATILPDGSNAGRPIPIAEATALGMNSTLLAPEYITQSSIALLSTSEIPLDIAMYTLG